MQTARQCNSCGKPLPASSGDTSCPSCLLEWGLGESSGDEATQLWDPSRPAPAPAMTAAPRLTYFGDYELIEEIARGGMGVVYRARQVSLNRIVAVKMILAGHFAGKDAMERFKLEAEAAARLRHPHIVGIHQVGVHEGFQYFSMDYIGGRNLGETARDGTLSTNQAAEWVKVIAEAIHYAHEQGILHRDIKPSNILIDAANVPHVTDFGLAKRLGVSLSGGPAEAGTPSDLTLSGHVLGSPNYMPPEQAQGRRGELGRTGDVYSLGAVLYYLLTGRPPFVGQDVGETLHQVIHNEVTSPRLLNPNTPEDLETICLKCLEKEPSRRYASAQALADELGRYLRNEPILARKIGASAKLWRWCRRKPAIAALAASLVVVFLLGFTAVLWQLWRVKLKSEENRQQLARRNVLSGVQFMQAGDYFKALLWFAEALRTDAGPPAREEVHRLRLASVLGECPRLVQVITHDGEPIASAAFSPADDRLATIGADRTLRVWEIPNGKQLACSEPLAALPYALAFSPDGARIAVTLLSNKGTIQVFDAGSAKEILPALPHDLMGANQTALLPAFDPTGLRLVTQPETNVLQMIDVVSGTPVGRPMVHSELIESFDFSADGSRLYTRIAKPQNFVWNSNTGEPLPFPISGPGALGKLFLNSAGPLTRIKGGVPLTPSLSPSDGERVSAGQERGLMKSPRASDSSRPADQRDLVFISGQFWRIPHGAQAEAVPLGERMAEDDWISTAVFSPEASRVLIAKNNRTAQLFDAATARPLFPPMVHDQNIARFVWSPDGRRMLTVSGDNFARVWDAETGQPLTPPISHEESTRACSFSGSGRYLLTVHSGFAACVWDLDHKIPPPVLLKPLAGGYLNEQAPKGEKFLSRERNNLVRVRSMLGGREMALNPLILKSPQQAWWDRTARFVMVEGEMARVQVWDPDRDSGLPITPQVQSWYTLDQTAYETLKLPSLKLSAADVNALARLLAGNRLDDSGGWTNLVLEEVLSTWDALSHSHAELFRSDNSDPKEWHQRQADLAEGAFDWNAAAFHWAKLRSLEPANSMFQQRELYALDCWRRGLNTTTNYADLRRVVPLRDPRADARLIDLSLYTTNKFVDWSPYGGKQIGWRVGWQEFDRVPFDVRTSLRLFGKEVDARGASRPDRINGIKVQQTAARLHFLHNAGWANVLTNGETLATIVVHYANAQTEQIPIQQGVNVADAWLSQPFAPEHASVAWIGPDPAANASQNSVRVVKFAWQNPHPEWEISHLDLISAKTRSDYNLMAITAEP